MKKSLILLLSLIILTISGCYKGTGDVNIGKDGSGTLSISAEVSKEYYTADMLKTQIESNLSKYNLNNDIKIKDYKESKAQDGIIKVDSSISFSSVDKIQYLGLEVGLEKLPYASMSKTEQAKYPPDSYKLSVYAADQSMTGGSVKLNIHPYDKVVATNGKQDGNNVSYSFIGQASENYVILKPLKFNLFNILMI